MAYHRHHGLEVRIVRIFNSILADEQVLYDDGAGGASEVRCGGASGVIDGMTVPAFDSFGRVGPGDERTRRTHDEGAVLRGADPLRTLGAGHPGIIASSSRAPMASRWLGPVSELAIGDRIAIAGRLDVPERDRDRLDDGSLGHQAGTRGSCSSPGTVSVTLSGSADRNCWPRCARCFTMCIHSLARIIRARQQADVVARRDPPPRRSDPMGRSTPGPTPPVTQHPCRPRSS